VTNKDLVIANLTLDDTFTCELTVDKGRGYVPAEENTSSDQDIGCIAVDAIYSPIHRVRYAVEATRVGKFTNYDRLVMEVWTDGTIHPKLALIESAKIYRKHLNPFVLLDDPKSDHPVVGDPSQSEYNARNREMQRLEGQLTRSLAELDLSVRARNCLDSANLQTLGDLVSLSENEVMNLKNLGKTSLTEIKTKLTEQGLSLGMKLTS